MAGRGRRAEDAAFSGILAGYRTIEDNPRLHLPSIIAAGELANLAYGTAAQARAALPDGWRVFKTARAGRHAMVIWHKERAVRDVFLVVSGSRLDVWSWARNLAIMPWPRDYRRPHELVHLGYLRMARELSETISASMIAATQSGAIDRRLLFVGHSAAGSTAALMAWDVWTRYRQLFSAIRGITFGSSHCMYWPTQRRYPLQHLSIQQTDDLVQWAVPAPQHGTVMMLTKERQLVAARTNSDRFALCARDWLALAREYAHDYPWFDRRLPIWKRPFYGLINRPLMFYRGLRMAMGHHGMKRYLHELKRADVKGLWLWVK